MIAVICLIAPSGWTAARGAVSGVDAHIGVVSVTDTQILRAERF
jgi:hypothetical protein